MLISTVVQAMFQLFHMIDLSTIIDCSLVLLSDDDVIVRKRVAAGLHEVRVLNLSKKSTLPLNCWL